MRDEDPWTQRSTWVHFAVLIAGTLVYVTGLFWTPSVAYFVPFGALLFVFPLLFALSLGVGLLAWRTLGKRVSTSRWHRVL